MSNVKMYCIFFSTAFLCDVMSKCIMTENSKICFWTKLLTTRQNLSPEPQKILEEMAEKADECDRESEDIRSEFMDENLDFFKCKSRNRLAVAYKKAYVDKRKEYHLIQAQIERFKKQQKVSSPPSYF